MTRPPEKKLARQHTRMDTLRPTESAMHSRGQTMLARTVCEWHPYDRPSQGMKMYVNDMSISIESKLGLGWINVLTLMLLWYQKGF